MRDKLLGREIAGIVIILLMLIAVIVMSVYLGIYTSDRSKYKAGVENVYRHAYYSLVENYVDIETNLSKVKVAKGNNIMEEILTNISNNAGLASLSLSTLNTENNELSSIFKFTNQVDDYAKFLTKKLERGEEVTDGERSTLDTMHTIAHKIGEALASIKDRVNDEGYSFVDSLGADDDAFSMAIRDLNSGSVEYPALIYDGPFSDGIHDREPKGLTGDVMTKEQGIDVVKGIFEDAKDVTYETENTNKFTSFLYNVTMADDSTASIELSEMGGHILMFTSFTDEGDTVVSDDEAIEIGRIFLERLGYKDMTSVYISLCRGAYYINYAPKVNDIIYYPDLIKIKISASTGKIRGMESLNYIYNHCDREVDTEGIKSETEIIELIGSDMEIESVALALIPKGVDREILTYEIVGTAYGNKYYVYLDALTTKEVNVLMEIESSGGNLLI